MPILELQTSNSGGSVSADASFVIGVDVDGTLGVSLGFSSLGITLGLGLTANLSVPIGSAAFSLGLSVDPASVLRLSSTEVNVHLDAAFGFDLDMSGDLEIVVRQTFQANFSLGLNVAASTRNWSTAETNELLLTVNIIPAFEFPENYQEYKARLTVNGSEIPIKEFSVSAPKSTIGRNISVTLSRISDKSLITSGSEYLLEIATVISGTTTWYALADGVLSQSEQDIGWENYAPTDQVTLSTTSLIVDKMNTSPLRPVTFFDPNYLDLSVEDLSPVYDVGGNQYVPILVPIGGLSLYYIMGYCFGNMGLGWSSNIPNFPVKRFDIQIGQPFWQAMSQLFGIFEPLVVESGGLVQILDSSVIFPSGFDSAIALTPDSYRSAKTSQQINDINGYILQYVESHEAWDDYHEETEVENHTIFDADENKTTIVEVTTTVRKYFRNSLPNVVVRQETVKVETTTTIIDPVVFGDGPRLVGSTREDFVYDHIGKLIEHGKRESAQIPYWFKSNTKPGDGHWEYVFDEVRFDHEDYHYEDNPFKKGTEYRRSLFQYTRALTYTDPDLIYETKDEEGTGGLDIDPTKEVPVKYKQLYVDAYRGGNLEDSDDFDSRVSWETVLTRYELTKPTSKDTAKVESREVDILNRITSLNVVEEQIGEFATSSQVGQTREALVFATGVRNNRRLEVLNIGEVPLSFGIALAQRKLYRNNFQNASIQAEVIGIDLGIERGAVFSLMGRGTDSLGSGLVEGFRITGTDLGLPTQSIMTVADMKRV